MQIDQNLVMADSDSLVQSAGTYLSSKSVDLLHTNSTAITTDFLGGATLSGSDPGKASLVQLLVQVTTTFTSGGSATLQVNLVMADNDALSTNLTVLKSTAAIGYATLVAGYKFAISGGLPFGITQRYLGLQFIVGTAAITAGNVFGALVLDRQTA